MTSMAFSSLGGASCTSSRPRLTRVSPASDRTAYSRPEIWRERAAERLHSLTQLPIGWDGYRAKPVSKENAIFAMFVLESFMDSNQPIPDIVPGINGDLQIEWHTLKGDLEVQVLKPNSVEVWLAEAGDAKGTETQLTNDFRELSRWLSQIKEPDIAAFAAA